jgi:hypothetical protein
MLIPFGVLSAAGAAVGDVDAYELISSTILGGTAASVTFSNLGDYSSTYKHLQIRFAGRTSQADDASAFEVRLNGDTGSNYARHRLLANYVGGSLAVRSDASTTQTSINEFGHITGGNASANIFGAGVLDILDAYSTSKNKTIRGFSGFVISGNERVGISSGLYINTASTTSVTLIPRASSNFATGSRFSLYGIRG